MSDLENNVKAPLERLVGGSPTELRTDDQVARATWAYKTMLLMQLTREPQFRTIPSPRFEELRAIGRPPADVRIWLGSTSGGPAVHEESTEVSLNNPGIVAPGFFNALALGNLYLVCAGRKHPSTRPFVFDAVAAGVSLLRVWPASVLPVKWPPAAEVKGTGVAALANLV